ncbi:4-amino-4-deoxy-L-arabinose transferase [Geodermatophilus siccatus]|uniref:4-amino-4-deoxy-L-arabinose transferase n=1 Tax=Geodermatophilus siccatus TaxID=1137991 RepID=A0A1G9LBY7_9ACTN|nr:hypothetical protein [Geodermatophilus siccatus]SDL59460.1 4-amino-4-deoxy-L-arabinose transferase [Geodermatophilus siccatus]
MSTVSQRSTGSPTDGRRGHRVPEFLVVLGVGVAVAATMTIPFLQRHDFYYGGDNPQSFVPLWHHFGHLLRAGQWPTMEPAGWTGGNYAAEGTYALWNPVQLLDYVLVSYFDDLATAAAVVQIQFLALLGMGAYLLFREYGAGRLASVAVALAVPATGFTLYYEANGWPAGLMAFSWVTWFWWAARRQSRGHLLPLVTFLLGALAMTTGNPYAALGMVVVLAGIAVELLVRRDWGRLVGVVVTGACVGATAALVFLPLVGTLPVTDREQTAMLANDTFLVPQLGDVLASSAPTYLPAILHFGGALIEQVPSTYATWFALPLLPWVRWGALRRPDRPLTSVAVVAAVFAVLTFGPSNLWLFRWPIRLIEYLYLALGVLLALLLSRGPATDHVRRRTTATVAVVVVGGYLSFAARPEHPWLHVLATGGVLALVLLALAASHRRGRLAGATVLVVGTVLVVTVQTRQLPLGSGEAVDQAQLPSSIAQVQEASSAYRGTVLQLASPGSLRTAPRRYTGHLLFGNETLMSGHESIVRYSGMGFEEFADALCMGYRGQVCPEAFDRAWRPAVGTGVPLVDLLGVETLVIDTQVFPGPAGQPPPPGWSLATRDRLRTVWVRDEAIGYGGRLSWVSPGVDVLSDAGTGVGEQVQVRAADAGTLVFARLAWPGYTATLDGEPVDVRDGPAGLLAVDVPAGRHLLEIDFRSPGLAEGADVLAAAALVGLVQSAVWLVARWRWGRRPTAPPDDPRARLEPDAGDERREDVVPVGTSGR